MSDIQTDLFTFVQSPSLALDDFAELCNALYERELQSLAYSGPNQASLLKRKLSGLPHHIKKVAYYLCHHRSPLKVDSHNASYHYKQASRPPLKAPPSDKQQAWFTQFAALGLVIPVYVKSVEGIYFELDTIDKVNFQSNALHTNKNGWFAFSGESDEQDNKHTSHQLLKPTKSIMQAACCGHTWNHKSKTSPRALTLREMLLTTQINWKNFKLRS